MVYLFSKSECCWAIVAELGTERDALKKAGKEIKSEKRSGKVAGVGYHPEQKMPCGSEWGLLGEVLGPEM